LFEKLLPEQQKLLDDFRLDTKEIGELAKEMIELYDERFTWLEMRTDSEHYFSHEHYLRSLAAKDPWEQLFFERMMSIIQGRLQKIEADLKKTAEAATPALLFGFDAHKKLSSADEPKQETEQNLPPNWGMSAALEVLGLFLGI
jgi:hypothetical protein